MEEDVKKKENICSPYVIFVGEVWKGERKKMASKFKLGDMFTKKYTRDTIQLEIYEITYSPIEPVYKLKPIRLCGDNVILGEEALIELYNKIN